MKMIILKVFAVLVSILLLLIVALFFVAVAKEIS